MGNAGISPPLRRNTWTPRRSGFCSAMTASECEALSLANTVINRPIGRRGGWALVKLYGVHRLRSRRYEPLLLNCKSLAMSWIFFARAQTPEQTTAYDFW
jgi:hypothetical protein